MTKTIGFVAALGAALALSAGCGSSANGASGPTTTNCGASSCPTGQACVQPGCGGFIPDGGTCHLPPPQCEPLPSQCGATPTCACLTPLSSCGTVVYGTLTCSNACA